MDDLPNIVEEDMPVKVLFVCLGNICRSPTAHGVFETRVREAGLQQHVLVDSAGTGDWHVGRPPDDRTATVARTRGYDLSALRARQVTVQDFHEFDYLLAMDRKNLGDLLRMKPASFRGHVGLFLGFYPHAGVQEVPDPYYGGAEGFNTVLDLVEGAAQGLLDHIRQVHGF
jgi:protein-tyrosine phosphatase